MGKKRNEFKFYDHMRLGWSMDKCWWNNQKSISANETKALGIKLLSHKRFSRSNMVIKGDEYFCDNFSEQSTGSEQFFLREVSACVGKGIYLYYSNLNDRKRRGCIRCNCVKGLRLELEIPRANSKNAYNCIMEYDKDPVLGKILRVWEYADDAEYCLTILEDGSAIETRERCLQDKAWHWE